MDAGAGGRGRVYSRGRLGPGRRVGVALVVGGLVAWRFLP